MGVASFARVVLKNRTCCKQLFLLLLLFIFIRWEVRRGICEVGEVTD